MLGSACLERNCFLALTVGAVGVLPEGKPGGRGSQAVAVGSEVEGQHEGKVLTAVLKGAEGCHERNRVCPFVVEGSQTVHSEDGHQPLDENSGNDENEEDAGDGTALVAVVGLVANAP